MKISILTPSFNQGDFIEKNIQSVMSQKYADFEHIIIDGGSTDNTVHVLKKYPHLKWVSETDEGQADALNKGLAMATGDIIGWINSDDYYEKEIFQDVISHFENSLSTQWIIGNVIFHYIEANIFRSVKSQEITYDNLLKNPDIVKQPGVFFKKELLQGIGGWNKEFHMIMDYDLWVRIAKKYTPKMINRNYAYFLWHSDQKSSSKNCIRQTNEICKILKENNVNWLSRLFLRRKKYYYLVKGLIKSLLIKLGMIDKKYNAMPFSANK